MKLIPLYDRIILRRAVSQNQAKSLIIVPDSAQEKPQEGEVVAVGPGREREGDGFFNMPVKPGDRVLFGKYDGTEVDVDGEILLIMTASDVFAIIDLPPKRAEHFEGLTKPPRRFKS